MIISDFELERDYYILSDEELKQLGITRRIFYVDVPGSVDSGEVAIRLQKLHIELATQKQSTD
jgi:hypothetical protein